MTIEHSGGADPARILPLLWRRTRPGRDAARPALGRRPRLSVDDVVAAAVRLADADGIQAMAMSGVAKALGVGTMTLYTYVPSKTELVDLMVDDVLAGLDLPAPGQDRPDGWRAQLELYAGRVRSMYRSHPWLRHVSTVRPPLGPGMLAEREYVLSTLIDTGLTPPQVDAAATAVSTIVHATAGLETESEQLERTTGQSHDAWWGERMELWDEYFDVERHPSMTRLWHSGGFARNAAEATVGANEFGLRRLLDGIAQLVGGGPAR
ncbi:regulatory protein, tetR family [Actinopolymorpha cephalotaxi]|uniref:AcrR family transcriptional regulator n=1 Tax=Actinopolymorpha cephalotaxi TaxID=504797 RepID=A0A1I2W161_9ACTN|nr:TetR/AcrR family transcriptional regulator [Actinopolymorpha cephalotaxi]NYH82805.1 AcrR family transcriptional regulator [Actinopolymorpha cephalotaxi]SFG95093.1 regulatory protein, tetR family [Actinopolymorpha cephalotaxi]